jgi:outer membrane protein insertion porin family
LGVQHTTLGFKDYSKVPNEIDQFVKQHDVKSNEVNLALGWVHNSLDRPMFPEKGISHALGLSMSAPGSHLQYYRLTYNAQWYRAFSKHYIGMLSTSLGYGDGYGKTDSLPFYKNFYGGGARSIRGFRESSLGPKDSLGNPFGGNFMLSATAMLIFPDLILPSSQAFRSGIFFDVGQVYTLRNKHVFNHSEQRFIDRNPKDLSYSVGVSVTWRSPMAPIVMSLGFPLNKKQGDKEKIVQFTFGTLY